MKLPLGSIRVTGTIESARGLLAAAELAAGPRLDHLAFGSTDFMTDIGADPKAEDRATLWARSFLVAVCRAAGLAPPIAPVWTRLDDEEGLRRSTEECRELGFFGRSCIHPRQLPTVHEVFTPSADQLAQAREVVQVHQEAERSGSGVAVTGSGHFVDAAVLRRAQGLIELSEGLELSPRGGT